MGRIFLTLACIVASCAVAEDMEAACSCVSSRHKEWAEGRLLEALEGGWFLSQESRDSHLFALTLFCQESASIS